MVSLAPLQDNWPALHIELVDIDALIPYIRNPRQHSPDQIAQLAASMQEFAWVNPVLRDEDQTILAGHGRILAARKLDWKQAPVMTAKGWPASKKRAYVIADNKLALNASWDSALLSTELAALKEEDFPLDLLGFSADDLQRLDDDMMRDQFSGAQRPAAASSNGHAPAPDQPTDPDQVQFTVPMTVAQRALVFEAISGAKRDQQLDQSGEALFHICQTYLQQQTKEPTCS